VSFGIYFPLTRRIRGGIRVHGLLGLLIAYLVLCTVGVVELAVLAVWLPIALVVAIVRAVRARGGAATS
jgi:hypothetical protein